MPSRTLGAAANPNLFVSGGYAANIGAVVIRIRFGVYYAIMLIRSPQNLILIILIVKAPTLFT